MENEFLDKPIEFLPGVGPQRAAVLKSEAEISTVRNLLAYYPFRYEDRTKILTIKELNALNEHIQLKGKIISFHTEGTGPGKRLVGILNDGTGQIDLVWFRGQKWIQQSIKKDKEYLVFAKPTLFKNHLNLVHPELEEPGEEGSPGNLSLQPVYHSTEKMKAKGLGSRSIFRLVRKAISMMPSSLHSFLPDYVAESCNLVAFHTALRDIHVPQDSLKLNHARARLKFEELFFLQLGVLAYRKERQAKIPGLKFLKAGEFLNHFYEHNLPYALTEAQKRVIREIHGDFKSGIQMNRLLQGDVGSGKTMVAFMSSLIAAGNGFQTCFMAPTEILANQHFKNISFFSGNLGLEVALLTGSTPKSERKILLEKLESGEINILIGTHALIESTVKFKRVGLIVIDEQHKFGVEQRAKLWQKNAAPEEEGSLVSFHPHILVMTATPIPRTLAMTIYGDLDVSVIDELPPGRTPVKTYHRKSSGKLAIYDFMRKELEKGRQAYVVYPLIEESEKLDFRNLEQGFEEIRRVFPPSGFTICMVHGKLKPSVKDVEMEKFRTGEAQIMVATNVIEVGVDVSNASMMVIESAERFGLSQLHQLRGRVGRGADQSFCILVTGDQLSNEGKERMKIMTETQDGFKIAEADLRLRGYGDLEGTRQSGPLEFRLADLTEDATLVKFTRDLVMKILEEDPALRFPKNQPLVKFLSQKKLESGNWGRVS